MIYIVKETTSIDMNALNFKSLQENAITCDGAIVINRTYNDSNSTAGTFYALGRNGFSGYTMERGGTPSTIANMCYPIPE